MTMRHQKTRGRAVVWVLGACLAAGAAAAYFVWPNRQADRKGQVAELIRLLQLQPNMAVAEIGAGDGEMTLAMAAHVGPNGKVFSTEIASDKLVAIGEAAANAGLDNVIVIEADEKETNLPPECCDVLFMRRVYHHFTDPPTTTRSLYDALRPGGRIAIIDFSPGFRWWRRPEGVPENRGGHGVPQELVSDELRAAGFELEQRIDDWPGRDYCLVFRKPDDPSATNAQ